MKDLATAMHHQHSHLIDLLILSSRTFQLQLLALLLIWTAIIQAGMIVNNINVMNGVIFTTDMLELCARTEKTETVCVSSECIKYCNM